MMNKIMHGTGGLKSETWFEMASGNARATRASADLLNVKEKHGRLELRSNFFSVRVTKQWNTIPTNIKQLEPAWRFKKAYRLFRETQVPVAEKRNVQREQIFFTSFLLEHEEPDCSKQ